MPRWESDSNFFSRFSYTLFPFDPCLRAISLILLLGRSVKARRINYLMDSSVLDTCIPHFHYDKLVYFAFLQQRMLRGWKLSWNWFHVWLIRIIHLSCPCITKIPLQIWYKYHAIYIYNHVLYNKKENDIIFFIIAFLTLSIVFQYLYPSERVCDKYLFHDAHVTRMWHLFKDCRETLACIILIITFQK